MLCPHCGRPTRVLRAEPFGEIATRITRICTAPMSHAHAGAQFATYELPETVVGHFGHGKVLEILATTARGVVRRREAVRRRVQALTMLGRGVRASTVARELGITEARVRQIRASA